MTHTPNRREGVDRSIIHTVSQGHEVPLDDRILRRLAESALLEDRAWNDATTDALVPEEQLGRAVIIAKAPGVIAGLPVARTVFIAADAQLAWSTRLEDGAPVGTGDTVATIEGSIASILRGERVALNFLGHLSGIATATHRIVEAIRGTNCRVRDTRKTIPGLRSLQKYAVRMGGGVSHRHDLSAAILIKDNHLAALRNRDLDLEIGIALALQRAPNLRVEVEVTSVAEARRAMDAGAHELLLDNMPLDDMREIVTIASQREHRPALEASGNITLENARAVAETGVDCISIGALTHSAEALDLSLKIAHQ